MITFVDVENNEYQAQCEIEKTDAVNGEKSLSGTIYFGQEVKANIAKGWTLSFLDEDYVVVTFTKNDKDNTVAFSAVQSFFYKMSKTSFYETWNGSHPLTNYLDALFAGTGYTYDNTASVAAFEKQNWGMKDRLSLFNDIINQANVEFYVEGTAVHIVPAMGSDLSTIVRKKFNLDTAEIQTDNTDFATYGRGYGVYSKPNDTTSKRLEVEYKSPLYDYYYPKFGAIEAVPVADERYTIAKNLLTAVKEKVNKSWDISLTLNLVDLQSVGYKYAMANTGDYITVIDENLNFSDKVRIIKVTSDYDIRGKRTKTEVECGSLSFAEQQKTSQSTLSNVAAGKISVPNEWLTSQVQIATNDLLAARTELNFTNQGIIAVDKTDANKLVILNSAGMGVSTDGGQIFKTAITADTINADNINIINLNASNITTGIINGPNLRIDLNTGEILFQKGAIKSKNGNLNIDIDNGKMAVINNSGDGFRFEDGNLFLTSKDWANLFKSKPDYGSISYEPDFLSNAKGMKISGTEGIAVTTGNYDTFRFIFQYRPDSGAALSLHDNTALLNARDMTHIEGGSLYALSNLGKLDRAAIIVGGKNGSAFHDSAATNKYGVYNMQNPSAVGPDIFMKGRKITLQGGGVGDSNKLADFNLHSDSRSGLIQSAVIYNRTYSSGDHVVITSYGTLGRLTSARKYKIADTPALDVISKAKRVLDIKPAEWYDKAEIESIADAKTNGTEAPGEAKIEKHYGFIADDFDTAGLTEVVNYRNGEVDSLDYDHIPIYHNVILTDHEKRITELEEEIKQLKGEI